MLSICTVALAKDRRPNPPMPDQFAVGRDTFFDFGPPFHYVELLLVSPTEEGTLIERIIMTAGYKCTLPPKIKITKATTKHSVAELLGSANPCTVPEKELKRELKRKKHQLVFSGANISMQVRCGEQARIIRSNILDRDIFEPHAGTPPHTSWTMGILTQLDQALGPGAMEEPAFALAGDVRPSEPLVDSPTLQEIAAGKFDALFPGTTDKPSQIYRSFREPIAAPTVTIIDSVPIKPISAPLPPYPALARAAGVQGTFPFSLHIQSNGEANEFAAQNAAPVLRSAMEEASRKWKFPKVAADQRVVVTVEFALNCHDQD
jgi:hypothetical protein